MQQLCNNVPFKNFPPLIKIRHKYPSKLHQTALNSSGDMFFTATAEEFDRKKGRIRAAIDNRLKYKEKSSAGYDYSALGIVIALRRLFCASN